MKKILFSFAAMVIAGSAFAQKDITDQYITNARLSDGTAGWTVKNFNAPAKGNQTKGYASESYAGWEKLSVKEYALTQNITLPAGKYRLANYSFFRWGEGAKTDASKSLGFLKAGDNQVALRTLGSIDASAYANSQAEGANCFDSKMYRNVLEFELVEQTTMEIGIVGTFDEMRSWCIAGDFELFDLNEEATADNPTDVTYMITNAGGEYGNLNGWENDGFQTQSNNSFSGKVGKFYIENWQGSGSLPDCSIKQTLTNIPAGYYTLTANAAYGGEGASIFLNDKETTFTENSNYVVNCKVKEGESLTLGAKLVNGTSNYITVDKFQLSYYPIDMEAMRTAFAALVTKAQGYEVEPMNKDVLAAMKAAEVTPADEEEAYIAAITALTTAIEKAEASMAYYNKAAFLDATGMAVFQELVPKYATGELVDEDFTAELTQATKAQTTAGSDFTMAIVNPEVNGATGWTEERPNGGNGPLLNGTAFEYWGGNASSRDAATFDYYQVITDIPNGKYQITAEMYNSLNGESGAVWAPSCALYGNDGITMCDEDSETLKPYTVEAVVSDGTLRIGVKMAADRMAARWFVADNFSLKLLEYVAPVDVTSFVGNYLVDATVTGNNVTAEFKGQTIKVEAGAKAGTVNVILPATEWKGHSMAQTELACVAVTETEKADTYSLNVVGQKITVDDTEFTVTEESTITYELGDPAILTAVIKATSNKGDIEVVYNTAAPVDVTSFVGEYLVDATVTGNNVTAEFKGQTIKVEAGVKAGTVNVILPATEWKGHSMAQTELAGVAVTETEKADTYSLNAVGQKITVDDTEFTVTEESTITYELGDPAILTAVIKATSDKGDIEVVYNTAAPVEPSDGIIYSWESPAGTEIQTGGTIAYKNGDGNRLNYKNDNYYTVCLNGKKGNLADETPSANAGHMVITLDEGLMENDQIIITAFRNKDANDKGASIYMKFENGTEFAGVEGKMYWTNINSANGVDYDDDGDTPNTYTWTVPAVEEGAKTITLTRNDASTNIFITKIEITRDASTAVGSVEAAEVAAPAVKKVFVDGQLIIFKDGKQYSATGAQMK